jgi:hypothetical protein
MIHRIASIDFCPPVVLSGSSDKHLRLFDMTTLQGWSTSLDYKAVASTSDVPLPFPLLSSGSNSVSGMGLICQACGSNSIASQPVSRAVENCVHGDLVRSVALGQDFVLSGSYDLSIKVGLFFLANPLVNFIDLLLFYFRYGIVKRGLSLIILRVDTLVVYFVLALIPRRCY